MRRREILVGGFCASTLLSVSSCAAVDERSRSAQDILESDPPELAAFSKGNGSRNIYTFSGTPPITVELSPLLEEIEAGLQLAFDRAYLHAAASKQAQRFPLPEGPNTIERSAFEALKVAIDLQRKRSELNGPQAVIRAPNGSSTSAEAESISRLDNPSLVFDEFGTESLAGVQPSVFGDGGFLERAGNSNISSAAARWTDLYGVSLRQAGERPHAPY